MRKPINGKVRIQPAVSDQAYNLLMAARVDENATMEDIVNAAVLDYMKLNHADLYAMYAGEALADGSEKPE